MDWFVFASLCHFSNAVIFVRARKCPSLGRQAAEAQVQLIIASVIKLTSFPRLSKFVRHGVAIDEGQSRGRHVRSEGTPTGDGTRDLTCPQHMLT